MTTHYTEVFKRIDNEMTYHPGSASKNWAEFLLSKPYMRKINLTVNLLSGDVDLADMNGQALKLEDINIGKR